MSPERKSEIRRYLLREQGFDEKAVKGFNSSELEELYEHYHQY